MAKRKAQVPEANEQARYPVGALPLPQAYERLQELFGQDDDPDAYLTPFVCGDLIIKVVDRERGRR